MATRPADPDRRKHDAELLAHDLLRGADGLVDRLVAICGEGVGRTILRTEADGDLLVPRRVIEDDLFIRVPLQRLKPGDLLPAGTRIVCARCRHSEPEHFPRRCPGCHFLFGRALSTSKPATRREAGGWV